MTDETWDGMGRRDAERRSHYIPKPGPDGGTSDAAFLSYIVAQLETVNAKLNAIHIDAINHRTETSVMKKSIDDIRAGHRNTSRRTAAIRHLSTRYANADLAQPDARRAVLPVGIQTHRPRRGQKGRTPCRKKT